MPCGAQSLLCWRNISVSLIEPAYVKTDLPGKQLGENAPWNRISNREEFDKIWGWWPPVQEVVCAQHPVSYTHLRAHETEADL
eukprot:1772593-Amphidinium_carterae.1